jgi:hypothetical protein
MSQISLNNNSGSMAHSAFLSDEHLEYLIKETGASQEILELNARSLTEDDKELLAEKLQRLDKKGRPTASKIPSAAGILFQGVDGISSDPCPNSLQFRPDEPWAVNRKEQKYVCPNKNDSDAGSTPYLCQMPDSDYWIKALQDRSILIALTEGVKKALCLNSKGIQTISLQGIGSFKKNGELHPSIRQFCGEGRKIYLIPDNDWAKNWRVKKGVLDLGALVRATDSEVLIVQWEGPKGIDDLRKEQGDEAVHSAISSAIPFTEWFSEQKKKESEHPSEKPNLGMNELISLALEADLFHTPDKIAYADVWVGGHRETHAVSNSSFKNWLLGRYFDKHEQGVGSNTLSAALASITALAIRRGEERQVHLRIAEHDGTTYIDIGSDDWAAIAVNSVGWNITGMPPVRFHRPNSLLPLPIPEKNGDISELRSLLNVDEKAWILLVTFILFCFRPNQRYPVLVLSACRGSGKSVAGEILKKLIDPGKAPLIKLTGDTRNLGVTASSRWLMVYDNLSYIDSEMSDDLCRMATGFGYSTRKLHSDGEEITFEVTRPQVITAIDALVTRDDLADRTVMVPLPEIAESARIPQSDLDKKIEDALPRILGAVLTLLSQALAELPNVKMKGFPRMADYARLATATEKPLGLKPGEFREILDEVRAEARQIVIESSPIGSAMLNYMSGKLIESHTAQTWLNLLTNLNADANSKDKYWPKSARAFSTQLQRLEPDLKAMGIHVTRTRETKEGTRTIHVERILSILPSASSASSAVKQGEDFSADDKKNLASAKDSFASADSMADDNDNFASAFASALEPLQGKDYDATDEADAKTDVFTLSGNDDDEILNEF